MSRKTQRTEHPVRFTPGVEPTKAASRRPMLVGLAALSAAAIAYGVYTSQSALQHGASSQRASATQSQAKASPALASFQPTYGFGEISMAAGKVKHTYTVTNVGASPLSIVGVSTSCMCTAATIATANGRFGPFGMAGHGRMPTIREAIAPGAAAQVEVVFDPAAHGPAGIGRTERTVLVETDRGAPLELKLTAMVRP
jgi:hypothetical protein